MPSMGLLLEVLLALSALQLLSLMPVDVALHALPHILPRA